MAHGEAVEDGDCMREGEAAVEHEAGAAPREGVARVSGRVVVVGEDGREGHQAGAEAVVLKDDLGKGGHASTMTGREDGREGKLGPLAARWGEDGVTMKKAGDAVAGDQDMAGAEAVIPNEDLRLRDDWMASYLSTDSAILLRAGAK